MKDIFIIIGLFLLVTGCAVKGDEEVLITISPDSAVVTLGSTKDFDVDQTGLTVIWSVEEMLGGDEGTIDSNGVYTAPLDATTAAEKVIIRATDTSSGSSGSATAFLTIFKTNEPVSSYVSGTTRVNTYSAGQRSIAVFKEPVTEKINVYVVWSDDSTGIYRVWFSKSTDGGNIFDDPISVYNASTGKQLSPALTVDESGNVFVVWEDYGDGDADIFVSKYDGNAFGDAIKVNQDFFSTEYDTSPSIAGVAGKVYIVWEYRSVSTDNYPDIYFATSSDGGVTFSSGVIMAPSTYGRRPSIAIDSSGIAYVAWEDLTGFPSQPTRIWVGKIEGGTPQKIADLEAPSGYQARNPSVAIDPGCNTLPPGCKVYAVWQRADIPLPKFESEVIRSYDIDFTTVETDDGITWDINTNPSIPDSSNVSLFGGKVYPTIAAESSYIYVAWDDQRNSSQDIYFAKSSDGVTFTTNRVINDEVGTWHEKPSIAVLEGKAYAIWTDYRNTTGTTISPNNVFFARED